MTSLKLGYTDWLAWSLSDQLAGFYVDLRWEGWRTELATLPGDRALHVLPPLVVRGPPLGERSRRAVPVDELWHYAVDLGRQLRDLPDGTEVTIAVIDD